MPVVTAYQIEQALTQIGAASAAPFEMFDADAQLQSQGTRIARSRAFRSAVIAAYGDSCAMCGGGVRSPTGVSELEAAHVVPRAQKGADNIRNGLSLCRVHHWAFDRQMIGLSAVGQIRIPATVAAITQNAGLATLDGLFIATPVNPALAVHPDALAWCAARFDDFWSGTP